jgi:threonine-phosphate decarboxylase
LWKKLQGLSSIRAFPSSANFFLARCAAGETLDRLIEMLMNNNILIRDCREIEGLEGACFRFAIKTRRDNELLIQHLRNC